MGLRSYDFSALENTVEEAKKVPEEINSTSELIDDFVNGIDHRLKVYFHDNVTAPMQAAQKELEDDATNCETFNTWIADTTERVKYKYDEILEKVENVGIGDLDTTDDGSNNDTVAPSLEAIVGASPLLDSEEKEPESSDGEKLASIDSGDDGETSSKEQDEDAKKLKGLGSSDDDSTKDRDKDVDSAELDALSSEFEKLYKSDPSIREKIKALYGFDIFNKDGTINKEKLALALSMDGKNPNDEYDIKTLLEKLKQTTSKGDTTNKSAISNITSVITDNAGKYSKTTSTISGAAAGLGLAAVVMAGIGSAYTKEESNSKSETSSDKNNTKSNITDELKSKVNDLIKNMNPSGSVSKDTENSNIAVATGLGAAGLTGVGILVGEKTRMLVFKPEDFINLPDTIKKSIISNFKNVKFSEEELNLFMTSNLKIKASIIDDIIHAIKKAKELDKELDSKIKQLYNFSMFTENKKISKYLILMMMLIDGKKIGDKYNLYNILNPVLAGTEDGDYTYQGISLQDIAVKEIQDDKEIQK